MSKRSIILVAAAVLMVLVAVGSIFLELKQVQKLYDDLVNGNEPGEPDKPEYKPDEPGEPGTELKTEV